MDVEAARQNLVQGRDADYLARCMDVLLQNDYKDPSIFPSLVPFLGKKLLDQRIIDYGMEPGVDITDHYFVLWEPFLRAKTALLVGTIAEKSADLPDTTPLIDPLVAMMTSHDSEEIELAFAFFAIGQIGLRQPTPLIGHFPQLCRAATSLVNLAANRPKAFGLFHSIAFRTEVFESFVNLARFKGVFEKPDNVQRFIAAGLPYSILQIALAAQFYVEKHPMLQWDLIDVFLRLVTEHPNGHQLFDLDRIPRDGFNDICTILRFAIVNPAQLGALRNDVEAVKSADRSTQRFTALVRKYVKKS
jgi:hypothetical protein